MSFSSIGSEQIFRVPAGVSRIHVAAVGGRGGAAAVGPNGGASALGGLGARVTADLSVAPGQMLFVRVAGNGAAPVVGLPGPGGLGGFNGGSAGGPGGDEGPAGGGGGASDLRTTSASQAGSLASRLLVAAGGGGGGGAPGPTAGASGGPASSPGTDGNAALNSGGRAGTSSTGGLGGAGSPAGTPGGFGLGGIGGGGTGTESQWAGGGGGGGYFGGGGGAGSLGGGSGSLGGGGGGGSSFTAPGANHASVAPDTTGVPSLQISYDTRPRVTAVAQSAAAWRLGSALPQISRQRRLPVGTTFSLRLDQAATVKLAFAQRLRGRRVGRACVAPTHANRHRPRCTRKAPRGSLSFQARAGRNRVRFQGRLSRRRKLKPGRYKVSITATASSGLRSSARSLSFRIVAG